MWRDDELNGIKRNHTRERETTRSAWLMQVLIKFGEVQTMSYPSLNQASCRHDEAGWHVYLRIPRLSGSQETIFGGGRRSLNCLARRASDLTHFSFRRSLIRSFWLMRARGRGGEDTLCRVIDKFRGLGISIQSFLYSCEWSEFNDLGSKEFYISMNWIHTLAVGDGKRSPPSGRNKNLDYFATLE